MSKKKFYQGNLDLEKQIVDLEFRKKEYEDKIKFDFAAENQLKNKQDEIDPKQVKFALMKKAMDIVYNGKDNPLETQISYLEDYIDAIENNKIDTQLTKQYMDFEEEIKEIKNEQKNVENDFSDNLESEEIKAIKEISKVVSKKYKEEKLEEYNTEHGIESPPKKDRSRIDELIEQLLKELNITL